MIGAGVVLMKRRRRSGTWRLRVRVRISFSVLATSATPCVRLRLAIATMAALGPKLTMARRIRSLSLLRTAGVRRRCISSAGCLYYGDGVSRDHSAGAAQWERAAAMGHFGAMREFGYCLYNGWGVSRDEARGVALVRSAAVDEGSWGAKEWLAYMKDELKQKGL
eukprot:Opistho-1_new@34200